VIPAVKPGEDHFPRISGSWIEFQVAIDIGELQQIRRLGNNDHIVEHSNPKGRYQFRVLPEYLRTV